MISLLNLPFVSPFQREGRRVPPVPRPPRQGLLHLFRRGAKVQGAGDPAPVEAPGLHPDDPRLVLLQGG